MVGNTTAQYIQKFCDRVIFRASVSNAKKFMPNMDWRRQRVSKTLLAAPRAQPMGSPHRDESRRQEDGCEQAYQLHSLAVLFCSGCNLQIGETVSLCNDRVHLLKKKKVS